MSRVPNLTWSDRRYRHEKVVNAYRGGLSSRAVAEMFGMNDSWVRNIIRQAGAARRPGRPTA